MWTFKQTDVEKSPCVHEWQKARTHRNLKMVLFCMNIFFFLFSDRVNALYNNQNCKKLKILSVLWKVDTLKTFVCSHSITTFL